MRGGLRSALSTLLLALVSIALVLGGAEVLLRLFWTGYAPKWDPDHPFGWFEFHPTRGLMLEPGMRRVHTGADFRVVETHNGYGLRSPEVPLEKPPERVRVLVAGDSMTYGHGVEDEEAFPRVMEHLDPTLQVINAGVPTYSGVEELILLQEEVPRWRPDVVVVGYLWNDLYGAYEAQYARYELREGELVFVPPDPPTFDHPAFADMRRRARQRAERYGSFGPRQTYLYRLVSDRIKILGERLRAWRDDLLRAADRPVPPLDLEMDAAEEEAAWQLSFALLREMAEVARRHGAHFLVLVVPDQAQIEPDVKVYSVPSYLWEVQERIVGFAREAGIPVLDPLPRMKEIRARSGEPQFLPATRHFSRVGNRVAAEILVEELRRRGWSEPASRAQGRPAPGTSTSATSIRAGRSALQAFGSVVVEVQTKS